MVFRRGMALRPINSVKNIREGSSILAAGINTQVSDLILGVESSTLAGSNSVERGSKVNGFYFSFFAISEGGEIANEVPLVDWYIIKDNAGALSTLGFVADGLPTPGATGVHENKRMIIHTEKGLTGGGEISLAGVPMIFKGVIGIPRGMRTIRQGDKLKLIARANFATKICFQAIYKWYK